MEVRMIKRWKPTVSSCRFCPSLTSSPSSSVLSQKALWWLQLVVGCIQLSLSFIKLFSFHNKKMLTGASASPIERWWFLPLSHSSRTAAWNFDLNLGGCNFFWQQTWKSSIGHWFTCSEWQVIETLIRWNLFTPTTTMTTTITMTNKGRCNAHIAAFVFLWQQSAHTHLGGFGGRGSGGRGTRFSMFSLWNRTFRLKYMGFFLICFPSSDGICSCVDLRL